MESLHLVNFRLFKFVTYPNLLLRHHAHYFDISTTVSFHQQVICSSFRASSLIRINYLNLVITPHKNTSLKYYYKFQINILNLHVEENITEVIEVKICYKDHSQD